MISDDNMPSPMWHSIILYQLRTFQFSIRRGRFRRLKFLADQLFTVNCQSIHSEKAFLLLNLWIFDISDKLPFRIISKIPLDYWKVRQYEDNTFKLNYLQQVTIYPICHCQSMRPAVFNAIELVSMQPQFCR